MMTIERLTALILSGIYFGYPDCCIVDCVLRASGSIPNDIEGRPFDGTGYVPCPICAATYTDEELLTLITALRACETPFPHGGESNPAGVEANGADFQAFINPANEHFPELRAHFMRLLDDITRQKKAILNGELPCDGGPGDPRASSELSS